MNGKYVGDGDASKYYFQYSGDWSFLEGVRRMNEGVY